MSYSVVKYVTLVISYRGRCIYYSTISCAYQNTSSSSSPTSNGTALQTGFCFWYMRRGKGANNNSNTNSNINNTTTPTKDKELTDGQDSSITKGDESNNKNNASHVVHPYENSIKIIATIKTVEEFWGCYDFLVRPNNLPTTTDYHFFREGIKPTWEDPNNARGGKWIVRLRKGLASRYWEEVILALIGGAHFTGMADGEVCGAVVSIRYSEDIVSVWNRTASDREVTERLRDAIKRILQLPSHVHMEYKPHQASLQDKSSFRNTQVWKPKSDRLDTSNSSNSNSNSNSASTPSSGSNTGILRRSGSWGDRDDLRGPKPKRDIDRSWR